MERRDIYAHTHTHTYAATYRPRWDIQAATALTSVEDRSVDYPRSNTDVEDPRLDMETNSSTRDAQLVFVCSFVSFFTKSQSLYVGRKKKKLAHIEHPCFQSCRPNALVYLSISLKNTTRF